LNEKLVDHDRIGIIEMGCERLSMSDQLVLGQQIEPCDLPAQRIDQRQEVRAPIPTGHRDIHMHLVLDIFQSGGPQELWKTPSDKHVATAGAERRMKALKQLVPGWVWGLANP
jgi:hypothetical protein